MPKIRSKVRRGALKMGEVYEMTANQCAALVTEGVASYVDEKKKALTSESVEPKITTRIPRFILEEQITGDLP